MICLKCRHYSDADREMEREQGSEHCSCLCHRLVLQRPVRSVAPFADRPPSPQRDRALEKWAKQ